MCTFDNQNSLLSNQIDCRNDVTFLQQAFRSAEQRKARARIAPVYSGASGDY
jgi:hypothetical protein